MTAISRRFMLGGIAATAGGVAATAIPLPAPAADAVPALSPEERLQAAIEELQAAAVAVIPSIADWKLCVNPDIDCPILIAAFTPKEARL